MTTLDTEQHVWCPTCKARPGEPCRVTKAELRLDPGTGLYVDHDGETCVHLRRISRADMLADGKDGWLRDELYAVVRGLEFHREGRVS